MVKYFFTSDTHFGDDRFDIMMRPFKNLDKMHQMIIEHWNSIVGEEDIIFHLGDVCYKEAQNYIYLMNRLNGKKHLVLGNHDV